MAVCIPDYCAQAIYSGCSEAAIRDYQFPTLENFAFPESAQPHHRTCLLVPSLALIFAVADDVKGSVPLRYVNQAIQWAKYLQQHAERVYACATTSTDTRHARALLAKIMEGAVVDCFTPRDVYLKGWSLLNREGVAKASDLLCDLDYLMRVEKRPEGGGGGGGRSSITYRINPNIKTPEIKV